MLFCFVLSFLRVGWSLDRSGKQKPKVKRPLGDVCPKDTGSALGVQKLQQFSQLIALWEQLFQGINTLFLTFLLYNLSQAVS